MADDIDAMLQTEDETTLSDSPADKKTQGAEPGTSLTEDGQQTSEEVEFNSLKGTTQERIKTLIRQRNEALKRTENTQIMPLSNVPDNGQQPAQVQEAVHKLESVGIATKKTVEETVRQEIGALRYENEMNRLASSYSGEQGPKFEREEYEDFVRNNPQYAGYLPEDVFKMKMYPEEFRDLELKGASTQKRTTTLRPTKQSVTEEPLTLETIEARLKEPDGRQWYDKNYNKINAVLAKSAQG